ncbi:MAG: hypothetical protein ACP5E3_07980 [Bacteroidales bacterium]
MMKIVLKYSYYIVSFLFVIGLILVVVVKDYLISEFYIALINYYFWYIFGLFSGMFLFRIINENYNRVVKRNKPGKKEGI